jgi:ketosteroid isomerase-like protein
VIRTAVSGESTVTEPTGRSPMPTTEPTTDNGRLIASAYEAFGRGDVPYVMSLLADDLDWIETDAKHIPITGRWRTPQDVLANVFAAVPEHFQTFDLRPDLWIEKDDDVVVTGHLVATTLDGRTLNAPYAHVFTVRDGTITRNDNHHDTARWLEVLMG